LAAFLLAPLIFALPATSARAVTGSDWLPGYIVSDQVFFNGSAMSAAQVQAFMDQKVPACQAGYTCLKDFRQPTPDKAADAYCAAYVGSTDERASDIIAKVGVACNVSQKAILVILQKEMGLVTHTWPSQWRFDQAMGYACPDTVPVTCNPAYAGFFYQVYLAARQLQRYSAPESSYHWYPIGAYTAVRYSTNAACGAPAVFIENRATAALYYYTPYQPNAAALANLGGTGDACSAYGNRNFWKFYWDWFGSPYGTPASTVAGTADAPSIGTGIAAGATVAVSPDPGSGSVFLQYLNGSTWTPFATAVSLVGGSAHFSWVPPQTFQYRARYGATYSSVFTITVSPWTVAGTSDSASIASGSGAGATVAVSPDPGSGTARLEYLNGSTWTPFATPVTLVGGSAHFSWVPPQTFQYRAVFGTTYSPNFTITVVTPTVTGTPDAASIAPGVTAGATVAVSPDPGSTTARLEYLNGSTWTPFAAPVTLEGGSAHFSWMPPQTFQYRAVFGSTISSTFTIAVVAPTVTGTADAASIGPGGTAGATVAVSPDPGSGTARLEYLNGSTWTPFATPVTLVGGSAHFSWVPPQTFQYRALFGSTISSTFTITVAGPTVTGAADSASIPTGGSAGATVTVSPAPGSGTARLEYLNGSTWTPFATPVTLVAGSAHFSWVPPQTFQYRAVFGSTISSTFTITVTPPTVTGTADAASIASGASAGATVAVSPDPGSGTARLEYLNGSTWTPFATPVTLVGGSAHFSWVPPQTFQYRALFGTTISPTFTITVAATS
jgi:hypothetical protein